MLQAQRLGAHLKSIGIKTAAIYSSDLQRAFRTADAIRLAQSPGHSPVIQLPILQEQDFGFYEGKRFYERPKDPNKSGKDAHLAAHRDDPGFVDVESKEAMTARASSFVSEYLLDHIEQVPDDQSVVVVAHGIILNHLWRATLRCFSSNKVSMAAGVGGADRGLEYLGGWSNTGYLDLDIKTATGSLPSVARTSVSDTDALITNSPVKNDTPAKDNVSLPSRTIVPPSVKGQPDSPTTVSSYVGVKLPGKLLFIRAVNNTEHLKGLKKARGGTGSLKHDSTQKTMDSFFKKRKTE